MLGSNEERIMKAYIFVNATAGKPAAVARDMRKIAGVKAADLCWGQPDIIAVAEAADIKALQTMVLDKVQQVAGVARTDTHLVAEG
jgi:DNA-binding Lrp family transcriptional regulator